MPRNPVRKPGSRKYADYTQEQVDRAVAAVRKGLSLRAAEKKFKIPMKTIANKVNCAHINKPGRLKVFSDDEEKEIVRMIEVCAEWGQPLDKLDLRMVAKRFLEKQGRKVVQFRNNLPGVDWVSAFLKRHNESVKLRVAANIKQSRAEKSAEEINAYFDHLSSTLKDIPPSHIFNYDETNLTDDPGKKVAIFKRGTKYPDCSEIRSEDIVKTLCEPTELRRGIMKFSEDLQAYM